MATTVGASKGTVQDAGSVLAQHVLLVDASGNAVVFGSGGTSSVDGAAFSAGVTVGTPMIGERDDAGTVVADGKLGVPRLTSKRAQHVTLYDSSGNELAVGGGTQYDEDTASQAAEKVTMAGVVRKDTAATQVNADGDRTTLIVDANGRLHVIPTLPSGAATESTLSAISGDLGDSADAAASGDGSLIAIVKQLRLLATNAQVADDAAFTPATSKVTPVGFQADESSTDSVDEGDAGCPRMTLDRKVIVNLQPHTQGGWSAFMASSADGSTALTNSAQAVKASAGNFGGYYIYNPNAAAVFVHVYDVASGSVTVGTTAPKLMFTLPAGAAANVEFANGISFGTAIAVAATSTAGGNGAPSTALDAVFLYK